MFGPFAAMGRLPGRFSRLPPREMATTLHVVAVIGIVELLIRWLPLPRLCRILGVPLNLAPARVGAAPLSVDELSPLARRQMRCTGRVADVWPFSHGPCLRRSLVAGHLLRRHDPALRLGVAGTGDDVSAHAWLEIDDRPLENISGLGVFQDVSRVADR